MTEIPEEFKVKIGRARERVEHRHAVRAELAHRVGEAATSRERRLRDAHQVARALAERATETPVLADNQDTLHRKLSGAKKGIKVSRQGVQVVQRYGKDPWFKAPKVEHQHYLALDRDGTIVQDPDGQRVMSGWIVAAVHNPEYPKFSRAALLSNNGELIIFNANNYITAFQDPTRDDVRGSEHFPGRDIGIVRDRDTQRIPQDTAVSGLMTAERLTPQMPPYPELSLRDVERGLSEFAVQFGLVGEDE